LITPQKKNKADFVYKTGLNPRIINHVTGSSYRDTLYILFYLIYEFTNTDLITNCEDIEYITYIIVFLSKFSRFFSLWWFILFWTCVTILCVILILIADNFACMPCHLNCDYLIMTNDYLIENMCKVAFNVNKDIFSNF